MRRLPEQRNFAAWKQEHLQQFEATDSNVKETWHLPMGISVDVRSMPYQLGGIVYLFRDISDALRKEETHQLLVHSQRAILETVADATALFGPDGRLKIHNDAFAKLWQLEETELTGEPHLSKVADLCASRTGRDGIWSMIAAGVNAPNPERFGEWGQILRADGRSLTLSLVRLPDGATLVSFTDMTDVQRFQNVLAESSVIAAA
jgi:PAS domain-containing protein